MHSRQREAIDEGLRRRQVQLLEAIAEAVDADVATKEQCQQCGHWFKGLSQHQPHCDGPGVGPDED